MKQEPFELLVPTLMPTETVNLRFHAAVYIDLGQFNWTICVQCNLPDRRDCLQPGNCILVLPVTITETLEPEIRLCLLSRILGCVNVDGVWIG
jgi:hypothetical protein